MKNEKLIVLASASPRRKAILKSLKLDFCIKVPVLPEITNLKRPSYIVKDLSFRKANEIKNKVDKKAVIIASDTLVYCKKEIIGKPKSYADARRMLKLLTENVQYVYSGYCVMDLYNKKNYIGYDKTKVIMNKIPEYLLDKIIRENMDKAGCYAIQADDELVKSISGDYYNVVGLPLMKVVESLKKCDVKIDEKVYISLF